MKTVVGQPLPLGATIRDHKVNFSVAVPEGRSCTLLLYEKGEEKPCATFPLEQSLGAVYFLALEGIDPARYEYNYMFDKKVVVDPFVKAVAGKETWNRERDMQKHQIRGILCHGAYDWEGDEPLKIPCHDVIAYALHVRGFTKHTSSKVKHKGTFLGLIEKIPYLTELGINQIHCMPVYEFEECLAYTNYWGYGEGFYFAPKCSYAASEDPQKELKDMVKACHRAGIEVVLEMPFTNGISKQMIWECLRYYMMEYHIDGFILNPEVAPLDIFREDPVLRKTKLLYHNPDFQTVMRRFLKGDEGTIPEVMHWIKRTSQEAGTFNSITGHSGFTLNDLVSYDGKHNEANGENNQDGPDYNYSWNCGAEGPSRKKEIVKLRARQMKNAFLLLLLSQGMPCILAGDEFGNSQKGNNNVYCQDNATGWLDWGKAETNKELHSFVKELIRLRKAHPILHQPEEMRGIDLLGCGIPDISYHGESAWKIPGEVASRQLGVYYCGAYAKEDDCFIAYNMHWLPHLFALPSLPKGKKWHRLASTEGDLSLAGEPLEDQRMIELPERTIIMLAGR